MHCDTVDSCFQEINAYCTGEVWGYPFLVNVENYNDFQTVLQRLEADSSKQCIFVSKFIKKNGLPMVEDAIEQATGDGSYALIGVSQAIMLKNEAEMDWIIDNLLGLRVSGHLIVLLSHCKKFISRYLQNDPRLDRRVVMLKGEASPLPQIRLISDATTCVGVKPLEGIKGLLHYMEHMGDDKSQFPLTVLTNFKHSFFNNSMYSITENQDVYESICQRYTELKQIKKENGSEEQWKWLLSEMQKKESFSEYFCDCFGSCTNLPAYLSDTIKLRDEKKIWLLWLGMKKFGVDSHPYLTRILSKKASFHGLENSIYNELINIKYDDPIFFLCYEERKKLISGFPEDLTKLSTYCTQIKKYEKNAIWYLTSLSKQEQKELVGYLSKYEYSKEELGVILKHVSPELECYFRSFTFDSTNTKLPDSKTESETKFRLELTSYFEQYKMQRFKDMEYICPDFLEKVDTQAQSQDFQKLQPIRSLLFEMDKENAGIFLFDTLGAEYLAFIQAKCESYGLVSEVSIGRCEPSYPIFADIEYEFGSKNSKKITGIVPEDIFRELEIIDNELRQIQSQLFQGTIEKAILLSEQGASCLFGNLDLDGGPTLEKVIVPIITLSRKSENVMYQFVNDGVIKFKIGQPAKLILFSNLPMKEPRIQVKGVFYEGTFSGDKHYAEFVMPEIKRTNSYEAFVYEGEKNLGIKLTFRLERATKEKDLFG